MNRADTLFDVHEISLTIVLLTNAGIQRILKTYYLLMTSANVKSELLLLCISQNYLLLVSLLDFNIIVVK